MAAITGKKRGFISEWVRTIIYALALAGVIRTLIFQPFYIPSGSMKETLLIGDFLFVNKFAYGYSYASCPRMFGVEFCGFAQGSNARIWGDEPDRGDVVVFRHPQNGADFVKRLIGMPGDRVRMDSGVLYINDIAAEQVPDGVFVEEYGPQGPEGNRPICANGLQGEGGICEKERFIETLPGGVSHIILNAVNNSSLDTTAEFLVPEGHYFFMGDNRDNSTDSRVAAAARGVGFVPYENIVGRADRVIFSSSGRSLLAFWTWRSDRFLTAVN
ncbi:MAG: signal peptidase I [Paracoccaceae bacterium]